MEVNTWTYVSLKAKPEPQADLLADHQILIYFNQIWMKEEKMNKKAWIRKRLKKDDYHLKINLLSLFTIFTIVFAIPKRLSKKAKTLISTYLYNVPVPLACQRSFRYVSGPFFFSFLFLLKSRRDSTFFSLITSWKD